LTSGWRQGNGERGSRRGNEKKDKNENENGTWQMENGGTEKISF
jgi:hypothetical protein